MNERTVLRAALTDVELVALVHAAGLQPGPLSPVADALAAGTTPTGDVGPEVRAALLDAGWLQVDPPGPSEVGRAALVCLARPQTRIGVVLGSGTWIASTISVAAGDLSTAEPMASIGRGEGEWFVAYPQPQTDHVAMLQGHFELPGVPVPPPFEATLTVPEYAVLVAMMDHRLAATLETALDRGYDVDDALRPADAARLLAEGRTSANLAWQVAVTAALHDRVILPTDEATVASGFAGLEQRGLVGRLDDRRLLASGPLLAVLDGLVPVERFAAVRVDRLVDVSTVESVRIVVRHGTGAVLFEEVLPDARVLVRSVSSLELADLLLNVRFPGGVRPPAPRFCGRCGVRLHGGDRFCAACGAPTEVPEAPR